MSQARPHSDSCTISVAEDGDVALFVSVDWFLPEVEAQVSNEDDFLVIRQKDHLMVKAPDLSAAFWESIKKAPNVLVVNVVGPTTDHVISVGENVVVV